MTFDQQKQKYHEELHSGLRDKSKKGFIDEEIVALVETINNCIEYYTTSSCSGRILLYSTSPDRKKNETKWLFVSHTLVKEEEEIKELLMKTHEDIVFFRFEPLILHIVCRDLGAAERLLQKCNAAGLKHSGAISLGERIVVEIVGNDRLDAPVANGGNILITGEGLSYYVSDANEKMRRNFERIERLKKEIERK